MNDAQWLEVAERRKEERAEAWGEAMAICMSEPTPENERRALLAETAWRSAVREFARVKQAIALQGAG